MIEFKQTTIAPAGRNKYGNYISSTNITKSVKSTVYAGNDTTTSIGGQGGNEDTGATNFYAMLSQTNATFAGIDLVQGATASTQVIAYQGYNKAVTLVCDINAISATVVNGGIESLEVPANSGMTGIPCGMTVTMSNNGTSASTIIFTADSELTGNTGSIYIPVTVYKRSDDLPIDDLYNWYDHAFQISGNTPISTNNCEVVWLEFVWNVNRAASSNYQMDLSNERAGVNVSATTAQGDILYPNSIASLTCTASTMMNGEPVTGVSYSIFTQPRFNARGVSINASTGVLVWDENTFNFSGPTLPIDVIATLDGDNIATKTMTLEKNYPGADGQAAVTRWIVTSHDWVHVNPNTNPVTITPSILSAWVMTQIGGEEPAIDPSSATTILYGYDTSTPTQPLTKNAQGIVTARTYSTVSSTTFALKNANDIYYEIEEVPTYWDGKDGTDGASGKNGTDGVDGKSAWYLTLDNDNASINADASGNIYTNAIRPTCHGKLYYGSTRQTNATYSVDYGGATGVSYTTSNGILTLNFGSNFNFTGDTLQITVSGLSSGQVQDVKYMNVTKSKAGAKGADGSDGSDGEDAVSYWLDVNYGEVIFDRSDSSYTPTSVSACVWMQRGEEAMVKNPDGVTVKYKWYKRSTDTWTGETTYTLGSNVNITTKRCVDNSRLRFTLYKGTTQLDQEDVDILMNGLDGKDGQGRAGAAIRGPYDYYEYSASTQCWCAGESGSTCSDCDKWIDVIYKDNKYYYCNTTYYGTIDYGMASSRKYWTSGDSFDFVATRVLLASAASINFLTNNWLYLKDEDGNIVGGARGTSVDSGITFWSGSEDPEDASFKVDYEGNVYAKQGIFAGYVQYPYVYVDTMMRNLQISASSVSTRYLSETNWQGKLAEAPKEPVSGMCYGNTTEQKIYFYTNRWVQMSYNNNTYAGLLADGHAYLLADNMIGTYYYSGSVVPQSQHLILPEPTSGLNGFTYDIVTYPDYATRTRGSEQVAILSLVTRNMSEKFYVAAFAADDDVAATLWKRIEFYAGHIKVTCMPKRDGYGNTEYIWVLTMCTAGMTTYTNEDMTEIKGAYGPIFGFSPTDNYYVPVKLQTESNPNSSNRMRNTIYITL